MEENDYFQTRNTTNILKLREIQRELPSFCLEFFRGIENSTTPLTRLNYAYDLRIFFNFLVSEIVDFENIKIKEITIDDLNKITSTHLEIYLDYLNYYTGKDGKIYKNNEKAKSRNLCSIRSFLKYYYKKEKIKENVSERVDLPKLHDKEIVRLEVDEVVKFIDQAENPNLLTKTQQQFNKHTRLRDVAMLSLFLGTGIRISECVGINIEDVDFSVNGFKVTRKGGNQVVLYFSDEVANHLREYLEERLNKPDVDINERALFLSIQNKRISVRAVEKLVKKYSSVVTPLKKITPHKLRSTYGTNLYRETNDIYVVADVLGHKDVNTTKKHYAAISEDARRSVANKVKLRDE